MLVGVSVRGDLQQASDLINLVSTESLTDWSENHWGETDREVVHCQPNGEPESGRVVKVDSPRRHDSQARGVRDRERRDAADGAHDQVLFQPWPVGWVLHWSARNGMVVTHPGVSRFPMDNNNIGTTSLAVRHGDLCDLCVTDAHRRVCELLLVVSHG